MRRVTLLLIISLIGLLTTSCESGTESIMVGYTFRIDEYQLSYQELIAVENYIKNIKKMPLGSAVEIGPTVEHIDSRAKGIFTKIRNEIDFSDYPMLNLNPDSYFSYSVVRMSTAELPEQLSPESIFVVDRISFPLK